MYTLTAYNQSGFFLFTRTFDTWDAFRSYPRNPLYTYIFDVIA